MAKRRKSIRKRPPKIVIELEEDVPEEEEDEIPITTGEHQDEHPDADAVNNSEEQLDVEEADGAGADGVASEDTEEMQRQEKAQEDWNAFKEEHHESAYFGGIADELSGQLMSFGKSLISSHCLFIARWL